MKIVICGSIGVTPLIKSAADFLEARGHEVHIPLTSRRIIRGELTLEEFEKEKIKNGDGAFRKTKDNVIRYYYDVIKEADAVLVLNPAKNGTANYIGGNTFLEMGFAHVLGKPLYLYNDIPDMPYTDEIRAMEPAVIRGDLSKIKQNSLLKSF